MSEADAAASVGTTVFDANPPGASAASSDAAEDPSGRLDAGVADAAPVPDAREMPDARAATDAGEPSDAGDAMEPEDAADGAAATLCLAAGSGDFGARGPYRVEREVVDLGPNANGTNSEYTIFSPEPLEQTCGHPIVAWGNGTAVVGADVYAFFQEHAASWGIVVIASHNDNINPDDFSRAIDYLLALARDPKSRFYQRLSRRAGVGGHAQGASNASRVGEAHPNVEAVVLASPNGISPLLAQPFLCLSGTDDLGIESCRFAVLAATGPALEAIWEGGNRIFTHTVGGFMAGDRGTLQAMRLYAAWYRCFLAADPVACDLFRGGEDCGFCDEAGWTEIVTKNL